ncbi:hypothetical protein V1511DRAFT_510337 [Dipodascopsis uninucleata]
MVSFSCEVCNDTIVKKKLMQHRNSCPGAYFTCLDCQTTFQGVEFQAHTSCISEAEKYQKSLYKAPKNKKKDEKKIEEGETKENVVKLQQKECSKEELKEKRDEKENKAKKEHKVKKDSKTKKEKEKKEKKEKKHEKLTQTNANADITALNGTETETDDSEMSVDLAEDSKKREISSETSDNHSDNFKKLKTSNGTDEEFGAKITTLINNGASCSFKNLVRRMRRTKETHSITKAELVRRMVITNDGSRLYIAFESK